MASQAGLFSASLTGFVLDSKQSLKPSPADVTAYYLRQHSAILSQISVQLSSITPQVSIPSTPPPPFPAFNPSASDIRVNIFWFMSLVFSLLAAILATLVRQWIRDYMHVFQRYGDSLKSSRLRQYLYEGFKDWFMPLVVKAVPGFLHISLFLFFMGLGTSLLNINTIVALSAIIPIGVSSLLYSFTTFAPIIYPQSPYQNSFSGILWFLFQMLHGRRLKDRRSDGELKSVSTNMVRGQMQLAMEETMARKDRDVRAIRWLINNLTEDAEIEKFLPAIPGSFNTDWGREVWRRVGEHHKSASLSIRNVLRSIIPNQIRGENVVHELSTRVARSVEICRNRKLFSNDDLWKKRTRACIEAIASLVCCANARPAWFGGISELLGDIGNFEKIRNLSLAGTDELFVTRWTCHSLVAIRQNLEDNQDVQDNVTQAMIMFARADNTGSDDSSTLAGAQKIDETLQKARDCLFRLSNGLGKEEDLTKLPGVFKFLTLRSHESRISELERINIEADSDALKSVDDQISNVQHAINPDSYSQIPGVLYDNSWVPFSHFVELFHDPRKMQFIRPRQMLKSMCSPATTLRNILEGQGDVKSYRVLLKNLKEFCILSDSDWRGDEMQRQLWRLQDLRDGCGLGLIVELFFLALSQLLSTSPSREFHSALLPLYVGTFRAITSDWSTHKDSLGTQKLLLDITVLHHGEFDEYYPADIVDEFLSLLGNVFEGQTGPHIDNAREQIGSLKLLQLYDSQARGLGFTERVLRALTQGQAQSPTS